MSQPLVEAMEKYLREGVYPLHTPGHKGGRGMGEPLASLLGEASLRMDVSLMAELDDIHEPSGCIGAAQEKAAELYGADACFFAVNGTTGAIQAMLMAALDPGDKVLVPRNAHRSVSSGLILADAVPVYVWPEYLEDFSLQGQITPAQVEEAFRDQPDLKAVLVTSPNYFGMTADLTAIGDIAHRHGALLLVDEAHGPHLGFTDRLPAAALKCGADLTAQSAHKLLGAMTQCSWLLMREENISRERVADMMSLLTTTSPNYLLMGSLDSAREQLALNAPSMMEDALAASDLLRKELARVPGLRVIGKADVTGRAGVTDLDTTKVTVNFRHVPGVSGIAAGEHLRRKGVAVELVDPENLLFLVTYADWQPEWPALAASIRESLTELCGGESGGENREGGKPGAGNRGTGSADVHSRPERPPVTEAVLPLRQVFYGRKASLPLEQAEGRICAESVSFYPPGIPVILPGERITGDIIRFCRKMKAQGLPVSGPQDPTLETVRVVAD